MSAMSARIRAIITCNEPPAEDLATDVTSGARCRPDTNGRHIPLSSFASGRNAMTEISAEVASHTMDLHGRSPGAALRSLVIGLIAFLTLVDLFATQAILPALARHYQVSPAAMGLAVNASTMGMAIAGLVVGFLSPHI